MNAFEITVPGYRVPTDAELAEIGLSRGGGMIVPLVIDEESSLRVRLFQQPDGVSTFGSIHCLSVGGRLNASSFPDWPGAIAFPSREVAEYAFQFATAA